MAAELYGVVEWRIELDERARAHHRIETVLKNVSERLRAALESISIRVFSSPSPSQDEWAKWGDHEINSPFNPSTGWFTLDLPQPLLNRPPDEVPKTVRCGVTQNGAVAGVGNLNMVTVEPTLDFRASTVRFIITLPRPNKWEKICARILSALGKDQGQYETQPLFCMENNIEDHGRHSGTFVYVTSMSPDTEQRFGLAYRIIGGLDVKEFLAGALIAAVLSWIVKRLFSV